MPNLAFSPGPQQPSGEKENASSTPPKSSNGGGINKKIAGELFAAGGRSSTGSVGRSPLESLAAAPTSGGSVVQCKRDSSCKCPDCDMAASVFGIDELRRVGGGGGISSSPDATALSPPPASSGGLARSPLRGNSVGGVTLVEPDVDTAPTSPLVADVAADALADAVDVVEDDPHEVETQQPAAVASPSPSPLAVVAPPVAPSAAIPSTSTHSCDAGDVMPSRAKEAATLPPPSAAAAAAAAAAVEDKDPGVVEGQRLGQDGAEELAAAERAGDGGGTPAPAQGTATAESGGSSKKTGWGFRMARAVFSPKSPKKNMRQGGSGSGSGGSKSGVATTAFAGELEVEATAAAAAASASVSPQPSEAEAVTTAPARASAAAAVADDDVLMPTAVGVTVADNLCNSGGMTGEVTGDEDDLASDDGLDKDEAEEEVEEPAEHEEGDAVAAAVGRGTCRPPLLPGKNGNKSGGDGGGGGSDGSDGNLGVNKNAAASGAAGAPFLDVVLGKGASRRRSSSGRRLSKDVFYECSSEVEHVLASDSESDFDDANAVKEQAATTSAAQNRQQQQQQRRQPVAAASAAAAATAIGESNSNDNDEILLSSSVTSATPITPAPAPAPAVEAPEAAAAAAAAAGGVGAEATKDVAGTTARGKGGHVESAPATEVEPANGNNADKPFPQDDSSQARGGEARGFPGLGRRRNRRQAPQLELGMAEAYGHEDDRAKFSQAEVDAKIRESSAEERAVFERKVSSLRAAHEAELQAAAEKLARSSSDGNRAKIAARDAEALEREIAMLSERYGEAAAEARTSGKALREKEALLDAVTAQLMGLKADLASSRAEHAAEKQATDGTAEAERRARSLAEGSLQQLEMAYNKLEDSEREKRAAGILKMKQDMQALARAQFAEANKKYTALRAKLERCEAQGRLLETAAANKDAQMLAAKQKTDELQVQVEALQKAQEESAANASRREHLLEEEARLLRDEGESRLNELETMIRERDAAMNGRDVSQDALARMAIRNTQMKESVADLESKVKELEGFCTEALDELDAEKYKNAKLMAAVGK